MLFEIFDSMRILHFENILSIVNLLKLGFGNDVKLLYLSTKSSSPFPVSSMVFNPERVLETIRGSMFSIGLELSLSFFLKYPDITLVKEVIGLIEFMISWVNTRINLCQESSSFLSSSLVIS